MAKADVINLRLPPELSAAFRRAAEREERSINGQATLYLRRCLIADGYYQPTGGEVTASAQPTAAPPRAVTAETTPRPIGRVVQPRSTKLPSGADTPAGVRAGAIVAAIAVEFRAEQGRPMGKNMNPLRGFIESDFPDVSNLASARAIGSDAWIAAGARPGLIEVLYPGDRAALSAAKKAQNRVQMDARIKSGSDDQRFISEKGIYGRGAVVLRRILAEHFAGLTVEEAFAKGPDAWLDGGVSEDTARRLFGDAVGDEAQRRAHVRSNAGRKKRLG